MFSCILLHYRKHIFNQAQHYIHFNLSMSLLLGLIVFVSAIETAVGSNVSLYGFIDECTDVCVSIGWMSHCSSTSTLFFSCSILLDAL